MSTYPQVKFSGGARMAESFEKAADALEADPSMDPVALLRRIAASLRKMDGEVMRP